jgi:hypothetical protein
VVELVNFLPDIHRDMSGIIRKRVDLEGFGNSIMPLSVYLDQPAVEWWSVLGFPMRPEVPAMG